MMERLQKLISQAGICSRRKAEELIEAGRVTVNGASVTELGSKADSKRDHIKVDGKRLHFQDEKIYLLLNKPKGYLCTLSDPQGRATVTDLLHGVSQRVFPVGRLDYSSEGLLLLTNDGDFANAIASAGEHCPKTYLAKVKGIPAPEALKRLSAGISIDGNRLAPCKIATLKEVDNPWLSITLIEGKNNQIRKMFDRIGHSVVKLKRIQIGFLRDPHLKPGEFRRLAPEEVKRFKTLHPRSKESRGTGPRSPVTHH
ncbi:MAG: rRNA pseudouridine synthase [Acidobacteria bacterium]|nr:rRNA pseudouridine synthase [Acidobacteriota bacterium]MCI0717892.1 rRNA pseudouridine synthase [Acidobacteriota bacterium]